MKREMDPQIRTFKDFLQLYNKITELCFKDCVDNFLGRSIAPEEEICVNKCVQKFANVNQRIMSVYVEVQTTINSRRVAELEAAQEAASKTTETQLSSSSNQIETPEILNSNR